MFHRFAFCALLLLAAVAVKADEEPVLLAHQIIENGSEQFPQILAENRAFSVQINVHNIGSGAAHNVKLTEVWPEKFTVNSGADGATWATIGPNEVVSHNLTVTPNAGTASKEVPVSGVRADLAYQLSADGKETQTTHSSPMGVFFIIEETEFDSMTAKHYPEWFVFLSGFGAAILFPYYLHHNHQKEFPAGVAKKSQ